MVWLEPGTLAVAVSQSLPTPKTQELLRVVVSDAVGAPAVAFPLPVAPIAPEPPAPEVSTPVKVTTVIAAATLCERVAETEALVRVVVANARQISAVPNCVFVRLTSDQVSFPPLTPVTVRPLVLPSVETNANNSSLGAAVKNVGEVMPLAVVLRTVETVLSIVNCAVE